MVATSELLITSLEKDMYLLVIDEWNLIPWPKKVENAPQSRVGNLQHSNVVYKHGDHSFANVDIFFHTSILGSRAPDADMQCIT